MWRTALVLVLVAEACSTGGGATSVVSPHVSSTPATHVTLSAGGVVEYPVPDVPNSPAQCAPFCRATLGNLALGRDGNVWFEDNTHRVVGRITPSGDVKEFPVGVELVGGANTMAAGSDGNMWVTANGGGQGQPDWILRITPAGEVTKLKAGEPVGGTGTGPESITEGPDGNMWFTEFWTNRIGRMSPLGILNEYPIPTAESGPRGIVLGPDNNLWFVESTRSRPAIARIARDGVITEYPLSDVATDSTPNHIVSGPDGNLWFNTPNAIGHISTQGEIGWTALPQGTTPGPLVAGPDGNIWFADQHTDSLVRMGVTGVRRAFPLPRRQVSVVGMTVGADGRIWFTEGGSATIAAIGLKVPEMLVSRRPLVFDDAPTQTVSVRDIGDAPLAISTVRVTGVDANRFVKGADTCSRATLAPDSSCSIELRYSAGGPSGIQSALLEITDNATASPQRLQLMAQAPQCHLPVVAPSGDGTGTASGEQLDVRHAEMQYDPNGNLDKTPGYYDRAYGTWLPVGANAVSPDGSRYVYAPPVQGMTTELRVVNVAGAAEKSLKVPANFWGVIAFTADGIYLHVAYEGYGPGAWLLNPDNGALTTVVTETTVEAVDGPTAWVTTWNSADKQPQPPGMGGSHNQVMKRDLATGQTTTWLYRPGTAMYVVGLFDGVPVVSVDDGLSSNDWIVTAPNQAQKLEFPFDASVNHSEHGFIGDAKGLWVGSDDGVYLWTPRTGSVLVSEQTGTPAGTCA